MKAPLFDKLIEYSKANLVFHMPGHKFGSIADLDQIDMTKLDNTEAMGMDNLYEAEGIIRQAMELMADFYGTKQTIFLTNGSTAGILTSILSICKEGDQLIVARNAHHSVWSALILAGVSPIYVSPEYIESEHIIGSISEETIEKAYKAYPKAKGVLVVSPTYEGIVSDIEAISRITHRYGGILIVDEAHGAHFVLEGDFPKSSIKLGADIVINSMHKTLPTLTQSALLHICSDRVNYDEVIQVLRMIQTSSPSYVMMGIMDYIRAYIQVHKEEIQRNYVNELVSFRKILNEELKQLKLISFDTERYDISKVIISTTHTNINGYELEELLNKNFNITVEAALNNYIILMTTIADQKMSLAKLKEALIRLDQMVEKQGTQKSINSFMKQKITLGNNPRRIFYSNKQCLHIKECLNRVSAKNIMLYPPGIPIIAIGEVFTKEDIILLNDFKEKIKGIKIIDNEIFLEVVQDETKVIRDNMK
ncbi:MAG: aminotransferase class I/II-fold pyridoxal phosphate-dependent enzyme [Cellulosilyticum sp.]|nr:aminotransferase class I/II-fold pyridoxal phosphate-dependent enzyme [Cellulosilyticum sp.]